jgi:hypothetical protein
VVFYRVALHSAFLSDTRSPSVRHWQHSSPCVLKRNFRFARPPHVCHSERSEESQPYVLGSTSLTAARAPAVAASTFQLRAANSALESAHARPTHLLRILAILRFGSPPASDAHFPLNRNAHRLDAASRRNRTPSPLVHSRGRRRTLCIRLVLTFLRRTQSPHYLRPPAMVVAR